MSTIVIPMAGRGSRFHNSGFDVPKMLIKTIDKRTILEWALLSFGSYKNKYNWVFVCLDEHLKMWNLDNVIDNIMHPVVPIIIGLNEVTNGQLSTVLKARRHIEENESIIIHNCDTYFHLANWNSEEGYDGIIPVFYHNSPNYSYVENNKNGYVDRVVEKRALPSGLASVGTYIFKEAHIFFNAADKVLENSDSINGEYYISSVYKYITSAYLIKAQVVEEAWPIGTPAELNLFNEHLLNKLTTELGE